MKTPARTRAETLFSEFTRQVDHAADAPPPEENEASRNATSRVSGPNTLHLPSNAQPPQAGWHVARPRGLLKPPKADKTS